MDFSIGVSTAAGLRPERGIAWLEKTGRMANFASQQDAVRAFYS